MHEFSDEELETLPGRPIAELRKLWEEILGKDPPPCRSGPHVGRMLAWNIQAKKYGGFSKKTERRLKQLGEAFRRNPNHSLSPINDLKPGTILVREWQGVRHRVQVMRDGFAYDGQMFESLSHNRP